MTSENTGAESQLQVARTEGSHRIVVRAGVDSMRIAAIWQVLLPFSCNVEKVDVATFPGHGFEEITIAFAQAQREWVDSIVERIKNMPWVTSVYA
jgi:(p)ppGpp synthase/HD superfamily hydrolase